MSEIQVSFSVHFDRGKAIEAQYAYCNKHGKPVFMPTNGNCPKCYWNIFKGPDGVSVEEAGEKLITRCPYCGFSFTE